MFEPAPVYENKEVRSVTVSSGLPGSVTSTVRERKEIREILRWFSQSEPTAIAYATGKKGYPKTLSINFRDEPPIVISVAQRCTVETRKGHTLKTCKPMVNYLVVETVAKSYSIKSAELYSYIQTGARDHEWR